MLCAFARQYTMNKQNTHNKWMTHALKLAKLAAAAGEVPVGAVIVHDNQIIGEGWNQPISQHDPTAHAEITALRQAANHLKNYRLLNTTLYVTLEPCAMCMSAIMHARVAKLIFGAWDPRAGAVRSVFNIIDEPKLNHRMLWQDGVLAEECSAVLQKFFSVRRGKELRCASA